MNDREFDKILSLRKHQILYDGEYLTKEEKMNGALSVKQLLSLTNEQLNILEVSCLRWRLSKLEDTVFYLEKKFKEMMK